MPRRQPAGPASGTRSTNLFGTGGRCVFTALTTASYWCGPVTASTLGWVSRISCFLDAEAAGDDHPAVLADRLADRLEALLLGAVEKAAGVDQHDVGAGIVARERVALRAQRRHDAFGVDERLRAAEADEADFGCLGHWSRVIAEIAEKAICAALSPAHGSRDHSRSRARQKRLSALNESFGSKTSRRASNRPRH